MVIILWSWWTTVGQNFIRDSIILYSQQRVLTYSLRSFWFSGSCRQHKSINPLHSFLLASGNEPSTLSTAIVWPFIACFSCFAVYGTVGLPYQYGSVPIGPSSSVLHQTLNDAKIIVKIDDSYKQARLSMVRLCYYTWDNNVHQK